LKKWTRALSLIALALGCLAISYIPPGGGVPPPGAITVVTSNGTFTTSSAILTYRVIVLGDAGSGASSTGAGWGGNGSTGGLTVCQVLGLGTTYTIAGIQITPKGAPGGAGNTSTQITVSISGGSNSCNAFGGKGGLVGSGSNAGGQTGAPAAPAQTIFDNLANLVGLGFAGSGGVNGLTVGAHATNTWGIAGGLGCAGANCATNTDGAGGEAIFIPEI
jgi:hypothetical protein